MRLFHSLLLLGGLHYLAVGELQYFQLEYHNELEVTLGIRLCC